MNDYMRYRAGSLHPNPHMHAQWWHKFLTKHRHDIKTLESPVKRYASRPAPQMAPKLHSHSVANLGGRKPPSSRPGTRPSSATSRPKRPQSAPLQRPMSAGGIKPVSSAGGWDPFRGVVADPAAPPEPATKANNPVRQTSNVQPTAKFGSLMTLKKVGDTFQNCLEDLDTVETDLMVAGNISLKRRFAMLKIQVADLAKQVDLIREEATSDPQ